MIGYLDTSAFVPLLVAEPASERCRRFWDDADVGVSCRLLYVETAAALAQARRLERLSESDHETCLSTLAQLWEQLAVVEIDPPLIARAAVLADRLALRGYDAVHCAAAEQLADDTLVAASGDRRLLDAFSAVGVFGYDSNPEPSDDGG